MNVQKKLSISKVFNVSFEMLRSLDKVDGNSRIKETVDPEKLTMTSVTEKYQKCVCWSTWLVVYSTLSKFSGKFD